MAGAGAAAATLAGPTGRRGTPAFLAATSRGDSVTDDGDDRSRGPLAAFLPLTGIGSLSALCIAAGVGIGWLVDDAADTPHVFVFVGLVIGVAGAVLAARRIVRRYF
jgi:hypothetical protein